MLWRDLFYQWSIYLGRDMYGLMPKREYQGRGERAARQKGTVQEVLGNFHSCFWRVGMGAKKAATCLLP